MAVYTDAMEQSCYDIYPEDEDYIEKLADMVRRFRPFSEALDTFICEHGYRGDLSDGEEKTAFIRGKFKEAGVDVPRNLGKWYTMHKTIERKTAFQICFAFCLDGNETNDFFRRICLDRGVDYHDPQEAVYYFALRQRLPYVQAKGLIKQLPEMTQGKIPFEQELFYTSSIKEELDRICDEDTLLAFLKDHKAQFAYNHGTASVYIKELWQEIAGEDGLAQRERTQLYMESLDQKSSGSSQRTKASLWQVYLQILGLSKEETKKLQTDRSLKPALNHSPLIHPAAADAFPDRDGLQKILDGVHVSNERVRKLLILLIFYKYWAALALKKDSYHAQGDEGRRCTALLEKYLEDCCYPALYAGNPYDWLFLYACVNDYPLLTFRDLMGELLGEEVDHG